MSDLLRGRRVLVTGGSGFIGGRLVERLVVEHGTDVRLLVRTVARAAPLSRFPVELVVGDIRDRAVLERAVSGCDTVFNCARGVDGSVAERRAVDVDATALLLAAAESAGVRRLVHVSTFVVYELPAEGTVDETASPAKTRDAYASAKQAGERLVLAHAGAVEPTVVQPTVVYGPDAGVYGRDILEELRSARVPLIDGGRGICNAVYVDDVVGAILLAAVAARAPRERFLVTGPDHPTWQAFFGEFERMLGLERTVSMTAAQALAHARRGARRPPLLRELARLFRHDRELRDRLLATREGALVRAGAHALLPAKVLAPERWAEPAPSTSTEPPLAAFKPELVRFLASRAVVSSAKAEELLGYRPRFPFEAGIRLVDAWARWAGLV